MADRHSANKSSEVGFSIIEVMIAVGILTVVMLAAATFFAQQLKANNFLEFQTKRQQLTLGILGQVLPNSKNCKCLFRNASQFPANGTASLAGYTTPTVIGKFEPDDCSGTPAVPSPLVDSAGTDGVRLTSVSLDDIKLESGSYAGDLNVQLETTKEVVGPKALRLKIRVAVATTPGAPGYVKFEGCSNIISGSGVAALGGTVFTTSCRGQYSNAIWCDPQAIRLCQEFVGSADFCVKDLYATFADGGDKNIGVEGYSCRPGLCSNGTNQDFTIPTQAERY